MNTEQKYALAYGFRRYSACKKLGWETIPAFIQEENKVIDVPMKEVYIVDNTRLNDKDESFLELMQSIKQHGLLEPIGLWNIKNLDEKKFIILNLIENVHRQGISPYELAVAVTKLRKLGLTLGEIAIRLSIPKAKIENLMRLTVNVPIETIKQTSFMGDNRHNKVGKLPLAVVDAISKLRLRRKDTEFIIGAAKDEELSVGDISLISKMIHAGMSPKEAIKRKGEYIRTSPTIIINKEPYERLGYGNRNMTILVNGMLTGIIPLNPELFYFQRDTKDFKKGE